MALQWDDLNFKTGVLNVNKQVYDVRGQLQVSTPKTKSSIRKIVLPPAVVAVLRKYKKDGGLPMDVPVPSKRELSHHPRCGAPQVADRPGTRRVQACEVP